MMLNSLSGRFLILTTVFVMLAEVLIFVPSVARFREDYLLQRLERAQIASLALLADDMIEPALEAELLQNAGVFNVVLRRDEVRQLMLSSPFRPDARQPMICDAQRVELIRDAMLRLSTRRRGHPRHRQPGARGRAADRSHHGQRAHARGDDRLRLRILLLSAVISIITALLLFLAVRRFW